MSLIVQLLWLSLIWDATVSEYGKGAVVSISDIGSSDAEGVLVIASKGSVSDSKGGALFSDLDGEVSIRAGFIVSDSNCDKSDISGGVVVFYSDGDVLDIGEKLIQIMMSLVVQLLLLYSLIQMVVSLIGQ
jgi:hypothetical protein